MGLSFTGFFSGAGGLDLGFEMAEFKNLYSSDIDPCSVRTLQDNRPEWHSTEADVIENPGIDLPNHKPGWSFKSRVHDERGESFNPSEAPVPCRFSRTGSDGHPIRTLNAPFPAIDTATIWGCAQGNVVAERQEKERGNGSFIRNKNATLKLWRIRASRLRSFTDRGYARRQTFPDSCFFHGGNKRHIHKQIGNSVSVQFALRIAKFLRALNSAQVSGGAMILSGKGRNNQYEFKL